ncbi:hypothetical protein GOP47_0002549 [Adiantum capillus-veneris]|uniref:adenylyl-sulfate kinase n=1 Tax=Adiantum capillus-veneris TaxID=13818 RepID=A0A9D4VBT2_ADICA|nr:hypothetical protein GOP47_0002549 [Adiantum capillus-veneris]
MEKRDESFCEIETVKLIVNVFGKASLELGRVRLPSSKPAQSADCHAPNDYLRRAGQLLEQKAFKRRELNERGDCSDLLRIALLLRPLFRHVILSRVVSVHCLRGLLSLRICFPDCQHGPAHFAGSCLMYTLKILSDPKAVGTYVCTVFHQAGPSFCSFSRSYIVAFISLSPHMIKHYGDFRLPALQARKRLDGQYAGCSSKGFASFPTCRKQQQGLCRLNPLSSSLEMMEDGGRNGTVGSDEACNSFSTDQADRVNSVPSLPGFIYPSTKTVGKSTNIVWQECMVKREERQKILGQKGCVIWITGLSGSGKSTLACTLDHQLSKRGNLSYVLDGDNLRHGLNKNLGFSPEDRAENIRRIGEVARIFVDAGVICIASAISPYRKDRDACRQLLQPGEFIEVYMNFPLKLCEERDPKGLYKLARAGKIKGFTGVDDPYEEPPNSEIVMELSEGKCPTPAEMAIQLLSYLEERGFLGPSCNA